MHTHSSKKWTNTRNSGQPYMLRRPGSSWGFGASVVVLKVEESAGHSLPPPTIPAGPETRTCDLWVTTPTLYPLGHNCPVAIWQHLLQNWPCFNWIKYKGITVAPLSPFVFETKMQLTFWVVFVKWVAVPWFCYTYRHDINLKFHQIYRNPTKSISKNIHPHCRLTTVIFKWFVFTLPEIS